MNLSPFPVSDVRHSAHPDQLPVLQNDLVDNFAADNTFPSPELFMGAVKLIINHHTIAANTFHEEIFLPAF